MPITMPAIAPPLKALLPLPALADAVEVIVWYTTWPSLVTVLTLVTTEGVSLLLSLLVVLVVLESLVVCNEVSESNTKELDAPQRKTSMPDTM